MTWTYIDENDGLRVRHGGGLYPVGDFIVPGTIEATFDRPSLSPHRVSLRIEMSFRDRVHPEVTAVQIERTDGGPPVRSVDVRVPVAELEQEAILAVSHVATSRTGKSGEARRASSSDAAALATRLREKGPAGRWSLNPEHLAAVVEIYRAGELIGRPVMHVAEHFKVPRPTASRWVAKARAEGYFDDEDGEDIENAADWYSQLNQEDEA